MSDALIPGASHEIEVKPALSIRPAIFTKTCRACLQRLFWPDLWNGPRPSLINRHLAPGEQSVGISMNLQHSAATPLGMKVRVRTEVTARDGKKLTFKGRGLGRG